MKQIYRKIYNDKINIDKKLWKKILVNDKITDPHTQEVLDIFVNSKDLTERAGIVAKKLKYSHCAAVNGIIKSYALRIINTYPEIRYPKYENGKPALFHVPFLGERKGVYFYWTLRPELVAALKEM